jgi:predicted phosphoribosyltransferase
MGKLVENPAFRDRIHVFEGRRAAGRLLAEELLKYQGEDVYLVAIPAGGVPVAAEITVRLQVPLDLIIVRKIQLPWTTEAGFGALDPAGETLLNQDLLQRFPLSPEEIETQVKKAAAMLTAREARLRGGKPYPPLQGRPALIVDDGLASGYTMRAAIKFLQAQGAGQIIVAVPTGSARVVQDLLPLTDELVCLNVRGGFSFAVADAYKNWYDLTEDEVLEILASLSARAK